MKSLTYVFVLLLFALPTLSSRHSKAFSSAEQKFSRVEANARQQQPSSEPTVVSDAELNAYLNEGGVQLPQGVEQVKFSNAPGIVTGTARIDFDKLTTGRRSRSMWMMLFNGVHDVKVVASAKGQGNVGEVHVQSMDLDGMEVPRPALEFLVERFVKPKYGNQVGLDSTFKLPARIERATVGEAKVTLEQR